MRRAVAHRPRKPLRIALGVLVLLSAGGLAAWHFWPHSPRKKDAQAQKSDTGLNRQQVDQLMRQIGYVQ